MKRLVGLAALILLLAPGCAGGGAGDLDTVAASIRAVEQKGASFQLTETETSTGGDIPKGKYAQVIYKARGQARDDNAALILGAQDPATNKTVDGFDLVVNDSDVYVRPHGSAREWFVGWTYLAEEFIPGVRLNLLRESVLLASKVGKTTNFSNGAFHNQYTITPAPDQLHQLMAFSSSGTLTAYLSSSGNNLQRVDAHFVGTDTTNNRHLVVDSSLTFSNLGKVKDPAIPASGIAVQPVDLFSTGPAPGQ